MATRARRIDLRTHTRTHTHVQTRLTNALSTKGNQPITQFLTGELLTATDHSIWSHVQTVDEQLTLLGRVHLQSCLHLHGRSTN